MQKKIYGRALDQIDHNLDLLKPGLAFKEFNEKSWRIPDENEAYRYSLALHGVGFADEWPDLLLHVDWQDD